MQSQASSQRQIKFAENTERNMLRLLLRRTRSQLWITLTWANDRDAQQRVSLLRVHITLKMLNPDVQIGIWLCTLVMSSEHLAHMSGKLHWQTLQREFVLNAVLVRPTPSFEQETSVNLNMYLNQKTTSNILMTN